jgi:hypothetical protein
MNLKRMSKKISLLLAFCFALLTVVKAQNPPNAFNYSAVARNVAGQLIANTTIGIQISILKTFPTGASQYNENHFVNTDAYGLFNLVIGAGAVQSGSMANIDWSNDKYYLQVGMDANGGSKFLTMGTTQLLSVPYALYAKSAGSVSSGVGIGSLVFPTITTNAVTGTTSNSATLGGTISNANGNQIMERGIVYDTSPNPTLSSLKRRIGKGIGTFDTTTGLEGLYEDNIMIPNTKYYVRAYAITENNLSSYGNEVSFTTLTVGQTGPGGGIVFFNKGNANGGWQYLEAAPNDQSTGIVFGCSNTSYKGTLSTIGSGEANTALIVAGCNEASFAAKLCNDLVLGGQNDWFLPSIFELKAMYKNLHVNSQGNFNIDPTSSAYSSSSADEYNLFSFYFYKGNVSNMQMLSNYYVRAIRAF